MRKKFLKGHLLMLLFIVVGILSIITALFFFYKNAWDIRTERERQYNIAWMAAENQQFQDAIDILKTLGDYQGAKKDIVYLEGRLLYEYEKFDEAASKFSELGDYRDSEEYLIRSQDEYAKKSSYNEACSYYAEESYAQAYGMFYKLGDYKDSQRLAKESVLKWRLQLANTGNTISAGVAHSGGLAESGTVEFVGKYFDERQKINEWDNVSSVAAGSYFFAALKKDGTVEIAKYLRNYPYPISTDDWTDIISISMGDQFIVGLKRDGSVVAAGIDGYGEKNIGDWADIVDIDTGWQHTVGLDKDGNVHAAGFIIDPKNSKKIDIEQEINHNDAWTGVIAIATGGSTGAGSDGNGHIVGLKQDGSVVAVGDNDFSQCEVTGAEWHDIVAISAGAYHTVALRKDGKVLTTQARDQYQESYDEISTWEHITAISAGYGFTLGLTEEGTVKFAGNHLDGQTDGVDLWEKIEKMPTVS